jgi:propanediol dehydratase small subunit
MRDLHSSREVPVVLQAGITGASGRPQLAKNPGRGVELVKVPESEILQIRGTLRPRHAGAVELLALAAEVKSAVA